MVVEGSSATGQTTDDATADLATYPMAISAATDTGTADLVIRR